MGSRYRILSGRSASDIIRSARRKSDYFIRLFRVGQFNYQLEQSTSQWVYQLRDSSVGLYSCIASTRTIRATDTNKSTI